jgi:hypothetical protein
MLNFGPKKPRKGVFFSLNPVDRERAREPMSRKRAWRLFSMVAVVLITGWMLFSFVDRLKKAATPATNQLKQERELAPMAKPTISDLPPLPSAAAIAEHAEDAKELLANQGIPLWVDQPDAVALAWIRLVNEQDNAKPPLPQRVEARDLILRHVRVGSAVIVSGVLEDSRPAPIEGDDRGQQYLLLALDHGQYVQVIAPGEAGELVVGKEVQVVGRYLGPASLKTADPAAPGAEATVSLPLIAARVASHPSVTTVDNPYVMRGAWSMPEDIYQNVDDDLLLVETRPYYFTLGQVRLDLTSPGVYDKAESANAKANDLHKHPADFRGKPFKVHGHVFHAWEDEGVAKDQPFGVDRVIRVILWNEDWGPFDQQVGDKVVTSNKLVLRAFELAMITHQPLPKPGDVISATGRFLRLRAMEVKPNVRRDQANEVHRQSDRAFTFLFVTNDYAFEESVHGPNYDLIWLKIGVVIAVILIAALLISRAIKESRKEDAVLDSVRRMRQSRQELKRKAAGEAIVPVASEPSPTGPGQPPAAPEPPPAGA